MPTAGPLSPPHLSKETLLTATCRAADFTRPFVDRSPEKAGVGGSIPSLATMFSATYRSSKTQGHSIPFANFWPIDAVRSNLQIFQNAGSFHSIPKLLAY